MPVPSSINDLSTTASSNSPAGSEQVFPLNNDYLQAAFAFIAQLRDEKAPLASPTFTGVATSPNFTIDANYTLTLVGGNPRISLDSQDYLSYDRTNNILTVTIGGVDKLLVSSSAGPYRNDDASTPNGLVRKSQMDAAIAAVSIPDATETTSGKAEIATQSETDTKIDDARIVTPKKLGNGLAYSIGASGFLKFPSWMGGLMIQWGSVNIPTGAGSATWVYPANFPSQVFVVLGTPNGLVSEPVCVLAQNAAQAIVDFASGSNTSNCFMFAIGN